MAYLEPNKNGFLCGLRVARVATLTALGVTDENYQARLLARAGAGGVFMISELSRNQTRAIADAVEVTAWRAPFPVKSVAGITRRGAWRSEKSPRVWGKRSLKLATITKTGAAEAGGSGAISVFCVRCCGYEP